MRSVSVGTMSLVLVAVSASSLISMFGLFQIERIVNQELYRYGLQFSYAWAMPYWTITRLMFTAGWFNIIAAIAFHIYMVTYGQGETKHFEIKIEKEANEPEILETTGPTNKEKMEPEPETKPKEPVEQPKEQESKPIETVEEKPKETPEPAIETQTEEKKEETPIAVAEAPSQTQTESKQPYQTEQLKTENEQTQSEAETPQEIEPVGTSVL